MVSYFDIEHRRVHCVPTCKGIQSRWQNKGASIRFQLSHYIRRLPFPRLGVDVRPHAVPATTVCGGRRCHMGPRVSEWRLVCRISFVSCYIFRVRYLFYVDLTLVECPQGYSERAHRTRRGGFPHTLTSFWFRRLFICSIVHLIGTTLVSVRWVLVAIAANNTYRYLAKSPRRHPPVVRVSCLTLGL